jgi:hypothetical protein
VEREEKRERETYEQIQSMRKKKKVKKNNYLKVEFLGQFILFLLMLKSGERERLKLREKKTRDVNVGERETHLK